MPRKIMAPAQLYAALVLEYHKRRPPECRACRVPLPFYRKSPDTVSANWHIGTAPPCRHRCDAILAEIMTELWTKYDMAPPEQE